METSALKAGDIVNGQYRVIDLLDKGDETELFSAVIEQDANAHVWMKTLSPLATCDVTAHSNLQHEAELLSRILSKNVIRILDFGSIAGQSSFIVEEALSGRSLRRLMVEHGAFTFTEALPIVIQLSDALQVMHRNFVLMGCVRPESIFLSENDDNSAIVKIFDFASATKFSANHRENSARAFSSITVPDRETCYYSPEQVLGQHIDVRSDVFSLAALMFEMLHGRPAFSGERLKGTLREKSYLRPERFADVSPEVSFPAGIEAVLLKAMEADPADRFQSVDEFKRELMLTVGGDSVKKVVALYAELQNLLLKYRILKGIF